MHCTTSNQHAQCTTTRQSAASYMQPKGQDVNDCYAPLQQSDRQTDEQTDGQTDML